MGRDSFRLEEVVYARNVITFFVWAWPSDPGELLHEEALPLPRGRFFPSGLCLSTAISRVV